MQIGSQRFDSLRDRLQGLEIAEHHESESSYHGAVSIEQRKSRHYAPTLLGLHDVEWNCLAFPEYFGHASVLDHFAYGASGQVGTSGKTEKGDVFLVYPRDSGVSVDDYRAAREVLKDLEKGLSGVHVHV